MDKIAAYAEILSEHPLWSNEAQELAAPEAAPEKPSLPAGMNEPSPARQIPGLYMQPQFIDEHPHAEPIELRIARHQNFLRQQALQNDPTPRDYAQAGAVRGGLDALSGGLHFLGSELIGHAVGVPQRVLNETRALRAGGLIGGNSLLGVGKGVLNEYGRGKSVLTARDNLQMDPRVALTREYYQNAGGIVPEEYER